MGFADFPRAASLGFQSGQNMANTNPLGEFIRGMIAEHQRKKVSQEAFQQDITKIGLGEMFKNSYKKDTTKEEVTRWAWKEYNEGNKSPEVLRVLGMYVSPMEVLIAQSLGGGTTEPTK